MVRFTHHDTGSHWFFRRVAVSQQQQRTTPNPHVILTGGRDLAAIHGAIREIVRFTHYDSDSPACSTVAPSASCCTETPCHPDRREGSRRRAATEQRTAPQLHVMLTPAAQLRACSGRDRAGMQRCAMENNADSVRWFAALTMTVVLTGFSGVWQCCCSSSAPHRNPMSS
jgi:hypothetical protein